MASAPVKKTIKKASTTVRRIFPTKIKGWAELAADAYGHLPGMRNWMFSQIPEIKIKRSNEDGTLHTFAKPISVNVSGEVVKQNDDGKMQFKADGGSFSLLSEIETSLLDKSVAIAKDVLDELPERNLRITWGEDMVTLKSKWFNKYTKIYKDGELSTLGDIDGTKALLILNFYGFYVLRGEDPYPEKNGAIGLLCSVIVVGCLYVFHLFLFQLYIRHQLHFSVLGIPLV